MGIQLKPKRLENATAIDGQELLSEVASGARLAEGSEGVRRILRAVFLAESIPIRNLSQSVGLPVPVVAAVRGELEKRRILTRKGGVALTDDGLALVQAYMGSRYIELQRVSSREVSPFCFILSFTPFHKKSFFPFNDSHGECLFVLGV